jgi:hypothetical protein
LEETEVGVRVILKRIFKFEWEEVKWIGVAQDGDNLCGFVNLVMQVSFHKAVGTFCTIFESKLSQHSALYYSVYKYIYRPCMSGPSNVTLL